MSDNRKRPIPSNAPGFPSKRANRLSYGMDRLTLNNDEAASSMGPRRSFLDHDMMVEPQTAEADQPSIAAEASTSAALIRTTYTQNQQSTPTNNTYIRYAPVESALAIKFNEHDLTPTIRKYPNDPRDIKVTETQRRYAQAIADYLREIDLTEFSPPSKPLRSLSSKDFHYIFTHLVQHYDPSYRSKKKIEDHVIEILNSLKYPLRDNIQPKSLLSIGAIHSNPNFYGMLHWLMEACKSKDASHPTDFEDPALADLEIEEGPMACAFAEFSFAAYRKYITSPVTPTYAEEMDPLKNRFAEISLDTERKIHDLETEIEALKDTAVMLESDGSTIENLKKRNHDLTRDITKFRTYCQEKRKRVEKYRNINKVVEDEVKRLENENQRIEQQKAELEDKLKEKNVSLATLESLAKENEAEKKLCADLTAHLEERRLAYNEKMEALNLSRDRVRKQVDEFNSKVKKLFSSGPEQDDLLLVYNPDAAVANEMLSYNVDSKLLPTLERLETTERQDFDQITTEAQRLREETDVMNAAIEQSKLDWTEKQKEIEAKVKKYDEGRRQFMAENEKFNIIMDNHEKALDDERSQSRESLLQAKERLFAEETKLKEMEREFQQEREILLLTANRLISQFTDSQGELLSMLENLKELAQAKQQMTKAYNAYD
ncbi:hypothetical protein PS6_001777 [Mucor atramentarius]